MQAIRDIFNEHAGGHSAQNLALGSRNEGLDLAKRLDYERRRTNLKSNQTTRRTTNIMQTRARHASNNVKSTNLIQSFVSGGTPEVVLQKNSSQSPEKSLMPMINSQHKIQQPSQKAIPGMNRGTQKTGSTNFATLKGSSSRPMTGGTLGSTNLKYNRTNNALNAPS